jgi:hypothetical protein
MDQRIQPRIAGRQLRAHFGLLDDITLGLYRKNPVAFVMNELHENPSEDQAKLLMDCADLNNRYFILSAGRGAGKTKVVSWITAWSLACLPSVYGHYGAVILGGSEQQSKIMYKYFHDHVYQTKYLDGKVQGDPKASETVFADGYVMAIPASERRVRGPHPELLILDEVCATDDELVRSALPMITGSLHGRVIMLSTPHKFYGMFQDYWDNSELYKYKKHGPWPLNNCHWIDQEWVALMKDQFSPAKYNVEILGIPASGGTTVFNSEWVDACTSETPFGLNTNYKHDGGIDWGHTNPSVLVRSQSFQGKIWIPGPEMSWQYELFPKIQDDIKGEYHGKRGEKYFADASHIGENERMIQNGIDAEAVLWTEKNKPALAELAQFLLYKKMIVISPDQETLLRQLKKYRWEEPKAGGKEKLTKKETDHVEAFLLSLYDLYDTGFMGDPHAREDKFIALR